MMEGDIYIPSWVEIILACDSNTASDIKRATGFQYSHILKVMKGLYSRGLIKRIYRPRTVINKLTPRGIIFRNSVRSIVKNGLMKRQITENVMRRGGKGWAMI